MKGEHGSFPSTPNLRRRAREIGGTAVTLGIEMGNQLVAADSYDGGAVPRGYWAKVR